MQYRMTYKQRKYVGITGSGQTGWESYSHSKIFDVSSDEEAVAEAKRKVGFLYHPNSSCCYELTGLARIDQPKSATPIPLRD